MMVKTAPNVANPRRKRKYRRLVCGSGMSIMMTLCPIVADQRFPVKAPPPRGIREYPGLFSRKAGGQGRYYPSFMQKMFLEDAPFLMAS
jgi:hypothetical protein